MVNQAATEGAEMALHDIFGDPVQDADLFTLDDDKDAATCQSEMLEQVGKLEYVILKEIEKAKKKSLKGTSINNAAALSDLLAAAFSAKRVNKAQEKFIKGIESKCAWLLSGPITLFRDSCSTPLWADAEACAIAAVRCRTCETVNAMDDLTIDCDQTDDGSLNLSCLLPTPTPIPSPTPTQTPLPLL
jgi:hypothetical protein